MTPLFTKMNLGALRDILVWNAPADFESQLALLTGVTIRRELTSLAKVAFALAFVRTLAEVDAVARGLPAVPGDPVIWCAYPKASSKRYSCEFHRDTGWAAVGAAGFEGVRQVAIDADWSAIRFRRTEFIRSLTRESSRAISTAGQARTQAKPAEPKSRRRSSAS
jgi:hypothetical protein